MLDLSTLSARLTAGQNLDAAEVSDAALALARPEVPDVAKAAFLIALADKGETATEVAAFARVFRKLAIDPGLQEWEAQAIDIVGTGGDHRGGFNISSLVTLVLACAGVPVMKHGNRGITSKCGSADLLAALGVDLAAPPEKLRRAMRELGFVFLFAPNFHPAFRHVAVARKALAASGRRSVFNFLGPLINPGRPAHVLLGTFSESWACTLAATQESLGTSAGLAVVGVVADGEGIDELTTATDNRVRGFGRLAAVDAHWHAGDFGLKPAPFADVCGGDVPANLAIIEAVLAERGPSGLVDTIVLNAATALWIVGRIPRVQDGIGPTRELLLGGAVKAKIAAMKEFYRS
jgi:anthranilate phosphoribosyltransferase